MKNVLRKWIGFTVLLVAMTYSCLNAKLVFEQTRIEEILSPDSKSFDFVFSFKNEGKQPVQIIDVKTSCGCTVAKPEKWLYQPGEVGQITGSFSIGNRHGKHHNVIQVLTDNLIQSEISLGVEVTIPYWIHLKPGMLLWRIGDELEPKSLTVTPNTELGVVLTEVGCDSDQFAVELIQPDKEGEPWRVMVAPLELSSEGRALIRIHTVVKGKEEPKVFYAHIIVRGNS